MDEVKFGTSGLRGPVDGFHAELCQAYVASFLRLMVERGYFEEGNDKILLLGHDLRPSSPQIGAFIAQAARCFGVKVKNCGLLPTPALALAALEGRLPAIMVTGSHIPADRNGLKFYRPDGEIDKEDEQAIRHHLAASVPPISKKPALEQFPKSVPRFSDKNCGEKQTVETQISDSIESHSALMPVSSQAVSNQAIEAYKARNLSILPTGALNGLKIGIYQQSSVARDLLAEILEQSGVQIVPFGRSDSFVAIDTEAVDDETKSITMQAARQHQLDAIVSTDGDGDRPLIAGSDGIYLRGDHIGLLCAQFLQADCVVTPVTSSSVVEQSCLFGQVQRCRVGSPYVLAQIARAKSQDFRAIVGFEANGGVLLGSDIVLEHGTRLPALATRDALLPILAVLGLAQRHECPIHQLISSLPRRFTASGRLENISSSQAASFLDSLSRDRARRRDFCDDFGNIDREDKIDGLRFILANGDIVHYRVSGNAPELRCYSEAATVSDAEALVLRGLAYAANFFGS